MEVEIETKSKDTLEIPLISEDRNYWFIRTNGGKYYKSFRNNDYIAISRNELDSNFLSGNSSDKPVTKNQVYQYYAKKHKDDEDKIAYYANNSTRIANLLNRFIYEIKAGDIVIIPSASSEKLSFGEVIEEDIYFEKDIPLVQPKDHQNSHYCPYIKRKKIKWLKDVNKSNLEPKLYPLFLSHHAITQADPKKYAGYIDRTIDSIYIKGDNAHLILDVTEESNINALIFANLIKESVLSLNTIDSDIPDNTPIDSNKINIKANVQSPGPIEFFGPIVEILLLSVIIQKTYGIKIPKFIFGRRKTSNVDTLLKELEDREFLKYKEQIEGKEPNTEIKSSIDKLKITNPVNNINSSKT